MNFRTLILATGGWLLAALVLWSAPALAAAPETPLTLPAEGVNATSATVPGIVFASTPEELGGSYEFLYKASKTDECKGGGAAPAADTPWSGATEYLVAALSGLTPQSEYAVCLLARNSKGETNIGAPITFTTKLAPEIPEGQKASAVTGSKATLNGVLNPDGEGSPPETGSYEFLYRQSSGECEGGSKAPVPAGAVLGHKREAESVEVSGLLPTTEYTFCLLVRNTGGEISVGPVETFTTPAQAPIVGEQFVTGASSESATLNAQLTPGGADTSYEFQYGLSTAYGSQTAVADAGSGTAVESVEAHVQGLAPNSTYHFRLVAHNAFAGGSTVVGPDETFVTETSGGEFTLPDGRMWEQVTPPNKHGDTLEPAAFNGGLVLASEAGSSIAYLARGGTVVREAPGNSTPGLSQLIASRGPDGWGSENITTPNDEVSGLALARQTEYLDFSGNLNSAIVAPENNTALPPLSADAEKTIYRRDNLTGTYEPLITAANTVPGAKFGGEDAIIFQGASPDLSNVVVRSTVPLTEGAVGGGLYEAKAGTLQLVSILPNGKQAAEETQGPVGLGGGAEGSALVRNAISENGTRIVWIAREMGTEKNESRLYMRDTGRGETIQLNIPEKSVGGAEEFDLNYQGASRDGSQIFFSDTQRLTADSRAEEGRPDLYVDEVSTGSGPLSGKLTDLTRDTSELDGKPEEADFKGILIGYGAEGAYAYFVANGKLAEGATATAPNLYVENREGARWDAPRFIATLSSADSPSWGERQSFPTAPKLEHLVSQASPSGRYLAFMSSNQLTGYDNQDVRNGGADEEVFLYDADSHRLTCVSCDPTGARPEGVVDSGFTGNNSLPFYDGEETWNDTGTDKLLAANIPGWASIHFEGYYQPRDVFNSGLVLFNSADGLVPADLNHHIDVYEYQPEGPACGASDQSSSEVYEKTVAGDAGCVALISSGTSSSESAFVDASAQGPGGEEAEDIFFFTSAQLSAQDTDNAVDIYDAHRCSAVSPCGAGAVAVPPACINADSCRAAPASQPSIFGAPSSATFSGHDNVPPTVTPGTEAKSLTRAQKLARALKICKKDRSKGRRAKCTALAHKRYSSTNKASHTHKAKKSNRRNK